MEAYKYIQDSSKVLKSMINEVKTMDNAKVRLTELNTLIKMLNSFKEMLNEKYYTEYLDTLLLSRMYQTLLSSKDNEINIVDFYEYLQEDLRTGNEFIKKNIIGYLRGSQLEKSLKKGSVFMDDESKWEEIINKTLLEVKKKIQWHKKIN